MALKNYAKLGLFLLLACFTLSVAAQDYPVNFDKDGAVLGRTDRYVRSLSIGDQSIAIWSSVTYNTPVYVDKTSESFTVKAGEEVTLSMDWYAQGTWMHTYAYVDWDRDGQFKVDDVSDFGVIGDGQEIVTFSYWSPSDNGSGYNSAGEIVSEGPGRIAMPSFKIPADAKGEYRLRFKLDWDNLDPGGCPSGNNIFVKADGTSSNAGTIIDVTLVVENSAVSTFKAYCARGYFNGGADSDTTIKGVADADQASEFALIDYEGSTYLYDATNKTFVCHSLADVTALSGTGNPLLCKSSDFSKIVSGVKLLQDTGFDAYPYHFEDEYGNYLNMDGARNLWFNKWTDYEGGAGGNTYAIQTIGQVDADEAIALLDAYFHPSASYDIVVVDANGTEYTVAEGLPAGVGEVIDALPEEYQKAFCSYDVETLTVAEGENTLRANVTYNLPFEEGKWYHMTVRSAYAIYDGTSPVNCSTAAPEADNEGAIWGFVGNPYEGVKIVNYLAGDGFSLGCDELVIARPGADVYVKEGDFRWVIDRNTNGFVFRHPENTSVYLHNRTPNLATCSLSEWWDVHEDAGSTVAITETEVPVNEVTGSFTLAPEAGEFTSSAANSSYYWIYRSTQTDPSVVLRTNSSLGATVSDIGPNNFTTSNDKLSLWPGNSGCYYYIDVQEGYAITGWHITGTSSSGTQTLTYEGTEYTFAEGVEESHDFVVDPRAGTVVFRLSGDNKGVISDITVDWVKLNTADVTYVVNDENGVELYRQVTPVEVGTVIEDLPVAAKRDFTSYELSPVTVEGDVTFTATATFDLPFEVSTVDNPKYYFVRQADGTYLNGYNTYAFFSEQQESADQHWAFFGNPYVGIQAYNEGAEAYVAGDGGAYASLQSEAVNWDIKANGDGFALYQNAVTWTTYNSYLYLWNWAGNQSIATGRFFVEEVVVEDPVVRVTEGIYNLASLASGDVLNLNFYNMAAVDETPGCELIERGDGTFTVSLPFETVQGQRSVHVGSGGNFSRGDATATTFYQVVDPEAATTVAKKVESVDLGAYYVLVGTRSDGLYALSSDVTTSGSGSDNQRMVGVGVTDEDGVLTFDRNDAIVWRAGRVGAVTEEESKGLTSGYITLRSVDKDLFLGANDNNMGLVEYDVLAATKFVTVTSPAEGTFNIALGGSPRSVSCGSNGRFSANGTAGNIQLFEIDTESFDGETLTAKKVNGFVADDAAYLIVGEKSGVNYALSAELYSPNSSSQRMTSTAVTIEDGTISVAADENLVWVFVTPEAPEVFEPAYSAPIEDTKVYAYRPTTRDAELVAGKQYMIYNSAVASNNQCWGFLHEKEDGLHILGGSDPTDYQTQDKNFLFTLVDNGDGTYALKNVATDEVVAASLSITKWEESSSIRGGGASLRQDDGTVVPNGDFTGECVFVVTDNNADSSAPRWNGTYWKQGNNDPIEDVDVALLLFGKGHPYAFYNVEQVEVVEEPEDILVTFNVYDEKEQLVENFTEIYPAGTVIETIPDERVREFCEYVIAEPITVSAEENEVNVELTFNLPFVEGQEYFLKANGKYAQFDETRNVNHFAVTTDENYNETPWTVADIEASENPALFHWTISGNPFEGYTLFNVGKQQYLTVAQSGYTGVGETPEYLGLASLGNGYTFTCGLGTLEDFYNNLSAVKNEASIQEDWATFTFEEVPEVLATFDKVINTTTGTFTTFNGNRNLASIWVANEAPVVTFTCVNGNNMVGGSTVFSSYDTGDEHLGLYSTANGISYSISVENGYVIKGFTVPGQVITDGATISFTSGDVTGTFTTEESTIDVAYTEGVSNCQFRLVGSTGAFLKTGIIVHLEQLPTEDVTFTFYDAEDTHVYTEVVPVLRGETITINELPESLKRDFTEYEAITESLTVEKGGHNTFLVRVNFSLPFVADGEQTYNLKVSNDKYAYVADGAVAAKDALEEGEATSAAYAWTFTGNPYYGIAVKNVATKQYLVDAEIPVGSWYTAIGLSEEAQYAAIEENGESFQLHFGDQNFIVNRDGVVSVYGYLAAAGTDDVRLVVEETTVEGNEPVEVDVTVNIVDADNNVLETSTVKALSETTISALPEEVTVRPFTTYAVNEPLTVAREGENVLNVVATFEDAPFLSKEGEDAKWFNITIGDTAILGAYYYMPDNDDEDPEWDVAGYELSEELRADEDFQWAVYGNPYAYRFVNKGQNLSLNHGMNYSAYAYATLEEEALSFPIETAEDGLYSFYSLYFHPNARFLLVLRGAGLENYDATPVKFEAVEQGGPIPEYPYAIEAASDLKNTVAYTIATDSRGVISTSEGWLENERTYIDATDEAQQFAFIQYEGATYLYSVGQKKFVGDQDPGTSYCFPLLDEVRADVLVEPASIDGYFTLKMNGVNMLNCSSGWPHDVVGNWNDEDPGNRYIITAVADFDPTEALAILTGIENAEIAAPEGSAFDLQGRRVNNATVRRGGLYIVNGKKVVVRK